MHNQYQLIERRYLQTSSYAIAFDTHGQIMISGSGDGSAITIWDFRFCKLKKYQQFLMVIVEQKVKYVFIRLLIQFCETMGNISKWVMGMQANIRARRGCTINTMTKMEDQLISCSLDGLIKIWMKIEKQQDWLCIKALQLVDNQSCNISLDDSSSQLVACYSEGEIVICDADEKEFWKVIQRMQSQQYGSRPCFIMEKFFVLQLKYLGLLLTYEFSENLNLYVQTQNEIRLNTPSYDANYLSQQYNVDKRILINRHGNYLYIIKVKQRELTILQTIEFEDSEFVGSMTDNGELLVTWHPSRDYQSKIQVRKIISNQQ